MLKFPISEFDSTVFPRALTLARAGTMPINRLFREGKIKPEELDRLNRAFTFTLQALHLVDRNDPICEIVAHKVIEIDKAGIRDLREIAKRAAKDLGIPE